MAFLLMTLQEIPYTITSTHSQFHVFESTWAMMSSEWELYEATKLLTHFKGLKGVSSFLLIFSTSIFSHQPPYQCTDGWTEGLHFLLK